MRTAWRRLILVLPGDRDDCRGADAFGLFQKACYRVHGGAWSIPRREMLGCARRQGPIGDEA